MNFNIFRTSLRLSLNFMQKFVYGSTNLNFIRALSCAKDCPSKALIILANGVEESEAVIIVDVLRRCGVNVTIAGLRNRNPVKTMNCLEIVPDTYLKDVVDIKYNAVVLPGGADGVNELSESKAVGDVLKTHERCERIIGAICAAPLVLNAHGIYKGKSLTSYPGLKEQLKKNYNYKSAPNIIVDDRLITSKGPSTAFDFSLRLAYLLMNSNTRGKPKQVAKDMLLQFTPYEL